MAEVRAKEITTPAHNAAGLTRVRTDACAATPGDGSRRFIRQVRASGGAGPNFRLTAASRIARIRVQGGSGCCIVPSTPSEIGDFGPVQARPGRTTSNPASTAALACRSSWVIKRETFNSSIAAKCNRSRERQCSPPEFRCWRIAVWNTAAGKARNSKGGWSLRTPNRVSACRH